METELIKIAPDGDQWNVLWGANPMEGIEGFGDTIEEAMVEFSRTVMEWARGETGIIGVGPGMSEYDDKKYNEAVQRLADNKGADDTMRGPDFVKKALEPKLAGNEIKGQIANRGIMIDGKILYPARSQKVYNHSPDGFSWSYGGSGPAQLALAIMLKFTDKDTALVWYQDFKNEYVANWPDGDFTVMVNIEGWIKGKIKAR